MRTSGPFTRVFLLFHVKQLRHGNLELQLFSLPRSLSLYVLSALPFNHLQFSFHTCSTRLKATREHGLLRPCRRLSSSASKSLQRGLHLLPTADSVRPVHSDRMFNVQHHVGNTCDAGSGRSGTHSVGTKQVEPVSNDDDKAGEPQAPANWTGERRNFDSATVHEW